LVDMPPKCWLRFHEPDGQVKVEMLGSTDDFAELVDPNDGSIRHAAPFAMHGGEWRIESVAVTDELIRIECISVTTLDEFNASASSSRYSIRR